MVVSDRASMEGTGVDRAVVAVSCKYFGEGHVKVVRDEWHDNIFFAIWDNEEVTSTCSIEVVLPSRARVDAWLRTSGTGGAFFGFCIHCLGVQCFGFGLLV